MIGIAFMVLASVGKVGRDVVVNSRVPLLPTAAWVLSALKAAEVRVADWAIYWPQYPNESGADGAPVTGWLTSRDWLVNRLHRGDRIWLFIGGDACGDEEAPHRAYVAQLLVVDDWGNNVANEPIGAAVPRLHIRGIPERCILVDPPALVDGIFRRAGADAEQHIGVGRQTPFELDGGQVAQLLALLREQHPAVHEVATQV